MAGASVTGIGVDSALKSGQRGSQHDYLGVEKLIGTRIVKCGTTTIGGGGTVTFSWNTTLPGTSSDYSGFTGSTAHSYFSTLTTTSAVVTGTASNVVSYILVRRDNATVTVG